MTKNYSYYYEQITEPFLKHRHLLQGMLMFNQCMTYLMYGLYPALLIIYLLSRNMHAFVANLLIPGICFCLLTYIRQKVNRKRPYEENNIKPLIPKEKKGESMPSRHVFSSALISMCWLCFSVPAGIVLLILTAILALIRVIGGVHYPSDVITGYIAGILSGLLLFLF